MKHDKSNNLYKQNPKEPCAFNSVKSFADNAKEISREQREAQFAARQAMIEQTRKALNECC